MSKSDWISTLKNYEGGIVKKSVFQLSLTLGCYLSLLGLLFYLAYKGSSYWIILFLAIPTAGFHVKTFIIMHDCSHNSYFRKQKTCTFVGRVCGLLTFTPYYEWRRSHAIHHASVANLEKRGVGDVWTMTVEEYKESSLFKRFLYRVFRNPFFLFGFAPAILFLIIFRFPQGRVNKKELKSILLTDFFLAILVTVLSIYLGFLVYLKVYLPIVIMASIGGVWLFYIQHQFKHVYWAHNGDWNSEKAAMEGCSYYKLPVVLRWFSGNIGLHHIHHLNSRIPNYSLKKCYNSIPELQMITPMTMIQSLRSAFLYLWDEKSGMLVNYKILKRR